MGRRSVGGGAKIDVRRGFTRRLDVVEAAAELAAQVRNPKAAIVLVFASPSYDADRLAAELERVMAPTPTVGCTTAGEIGPAGFVENSAVAVSLASSGLRVGLGLGDDVCTAAFRRGGAALRKAAAELGLSGDPRELENCVGLSIIDGRSGQEEVFTAGVASAMPELRLVGGSASDLVDQEPAARIFHAGKSWSGCGLVVLFQSDTPMLAFKSEHMIPADRRVVVTDVDSRLVHELDGRPAVEVYREIIGVSEGEIESELAGTHPFAQYVGEQPYVRSVMGVEGDSLRFACTVDRGVVLRPVVPGDLVRKTDEALRAADEQLGGISALIVFNCLGRHFEAQAKGKTEELGALFSRYPVVGFNTFGEQFGALHVNHTLTALAFAGGATRDPE